MAIGNTVSVSTTSYVVADSNYKITATVYATEKSVSKSTNSSVVSFELKIVTTGTSGYTFYGSTRNQAGTYKGIVGGSVIKSGYIGIPHGMTSGQTLVDITWEQTITHSSDGTYNLQFGVDIDSAADDYGHVNWYWADGAQNLAWLPLTNIQNQQQQQSTLTFNSTMTAGNTYTITVNGNSSYYHKISYWFGASENGLTEGLSKYSGVRGGESITFTPPLSLYQYLSSSQTSGTGYINLDTYSNSAMTSHIGNGWSSRYTLSFGSSATIKPTIDSIVITENNSSLKSLGVGSTEIVAGLSTKKIVVNATAKVGEINEITATLGYSREDEGSPATFYFTPKESEKTTTLTVTVIDSYGNLTSTTREMTWVPYYAPSINNVVAERTSSTSTTGTLNANGNFYNGAIGTTTNKLTVKYKVNDSSSSTTASYIDNWTMNTISLTGLSLRSSYKYTVTVTDSIGNSATKSTTLQLPTSALWVGKHTVRVDDYLIVDTDMAVGGKSLLDRTYPVGSIYMSLNNTNPADLFGGTWKRLAAGKFLISGYDEPTYEWQKIGYDLTIGETGGSISHDHGGNTRKHTLTVSEMPSHRHSHPNDGHTFTWGNSHQTTIFNNAGNVQAGKPSQNQLATAQNTNHYTDYTGDGEGHNHGINPDYHIPPYLAVCMWQRTA